MNAELIEYLARVSTHRRLVHYLRWAPLMHVKHQFSRRHLLGSLVVSQKGSFLTQTATLAVNSG